MRTFAVAFRGTKNIIRAFDFRRPSETQSGRWEFVSEDGEVLWDFDKADVESCVEDISIQEVSA
jgi:hypothetical protein